MDIEAITQEYYKNVWPNNIKKLRLEAGMTQKKLAELSGITRTTLWKLETGRLVRISCGKFDGVARALNVRTDDLLENKAED